ncbi:MAG: NAD(+) synthase [Deltaproteobacteria bacterium]|nr:NAD(+) synthase [Deltaproteobacteria bacterium]
MINIRVGAAVLNLTPLAWESNKDIIVSAIREARRQSVSLLCLPELCITGYGCQDAFHSPSVHKTALDVLVRDILPETHGLAVAVGLPIAFRNSIFNACAVVVNGRIAGLVCKRFLAGDGVHYEPRWFKPWPSGAQATLQIDGHAVPIGDLTFDLGGVKVGFEICEDAWVAQRPGSSMAGRGVDVILNPSASHFAFGKLDVRKRFVIEGSRAFGVSYVYANLLGTDEGRIIYDGGALIATQGRLVAEGPRLAMADFLLTTAVVDVEQTRMIQGWTSSFRPRFDMNPHELVELPFVWPDIPPAAEVPLSTEPWELSPHRKEEELWRALTLGLFDYMRKSSSRGFVISLSGGADSTVCACLVRLMLERAIAELGMDGLKRRLAYDKLAQAAADVEALARHLLCVAYQATANSGAVTHDAAKTIAAAVGATWLDLDVEAMRAGYVALIEQGIGRALTWERDDLTLQNIQARVRAPSIWMLANLRGALLLATSNRSEAAVGYTTMDGDSAGGLSPIAGVDKNFIRRWLRWLESDGPIGYAPMPAVRVVNVQQPTAELRPADKMQTDEADLMPYDLLDAIERAAIRDKQDPLECYRLTRAQFPQHDPHQLLVWVERFFRLWCRNQWKRERYAPSFHVDDENLDPKTWCRFPILSGGYQRELAELRAWVHAHYGAPT